MPNKPSIATPSPALVLQAQRLAERSAAGSPASAPELAEVAQSLQVPVQTLQDALDQAIKGGLVQVEDAGARSAPLRQQLQDGATYKNAPKVDLKSTSALAGHNMVVNKGAATDAMHKGSAATKANAVAKISAKAQLQNVPSLRDLEALKVGAKSADEVAAALKEGLLSPNPTVVKKAARTLRTAEAYGRKAQADQQNYAGTGFWEMDFPKVQVRLSAQQTRQVLQNVVATRDPQTAGSLLLAAKEGLVQTEPKGAFDTHQAMQKMWPNDQPAILPGSHGTEVPLRGSFVAEYQKDVEPGERNIEQVVVETAKAAGATCPFAQGNHAKGVAFGDGEFKVNAQAPEWVKDLVGDAPLKGAMMRISTSATSPDDHDNKPAQTGVRLVIPVIGKAGETNSSTWDVTANTGSTTHRPNPREHTEFTQALSVPRDGLSGTRVARLGRYLWGGVKNRNVIDRIKGIRAALEPTKEAMTTPFDEQNLFARHTLFVGGRYVQVRYDVVEPTDFKVPDPSRKDGQLETKADGIKAHGVKIRVYMKELPADADPALVEKEGWTNADLKDGQSFKEFCFGEVAFDPQSSSPDSAASEFFEAYAHVPGRQSQIARGVGVIGRGRSPVYFASETARHQPR